jgi:hypothetical protein
MISVGKVAWWNKNGQTHSRKKESGMIAPSRGTSPSFLSDMQISYRMIYTAIDTKIQGI